MEYPPSLFYPTQDAGNETLLTVEDEYDPEKPNSYLLVCEKREKEEEENQRVFLVKQQLAENEKHMKEERKRLEENIRKGTIFDSIPSNGMGRGAAMTLPAWMTEGKAHTGNDTSTI